MSTPNVFFVPNKGPTSRPGKFPIPMQTVLETAEGSYSFPIPRHHQRTRVPAIIPDIIMESAEGSFRLFPQRQGKKTTFVFDS